MKISLNQQKTQIEVKFGLCQSTHNDNVLIKNRLLEIYSYTTVMVMCLKQEQNAN